MPFVPRLPIRNLENYASVRIITSGIMFYMLRSFEVSVL